jgi:spore maturation protein CgeB
MHESSQVKIALIGQKFPEWYGSMFSWVCKAFELNGYKFDTYDRNNATSNKVYDLALYIDCSEDFSSEMNIKADVSACWLMDSHMPMGLMRASNIAKKCQLVVSSNKEYGVDLLAKIGIESKLLPITYVIDGLYDKDKYDVTMIGHGNSQARLDLWKMLSSYNSRVGVCNTLDDYKEAFNTKIVVNQPTEPFDVILNNRFFEALGNKKLLLQKKLKTNLIEDLGFVGGEDFLYWHDFDELKGLIDYYLKNTEAIDIVAEKGFTKVQKYHLKYQVVQLMKWVKLLGRSNGN